MSETKTKIDLFIRINKMKQKISEIINERGLKKDSEIEELEEYKNLIKDTKEFKELYGI